MVYIYIIVLIVSTYMYGCHVDTSFENGFAANVAACKTHFNARTPRSQCAAMFINLYRYLHDIII